MVSGSMKGIFPLLVNLCEHLGAFNVVHVLLSGMRIIFGVGYERNL